jgi:tRNA 5-methylaminomethyl-2-thiouridine biosynthesis bifunctional protein
MPTIRSQQFDDIYFSPEDGLEESRYVFLRGNNLPEAFDGKENFTIVETGFGTGLNFLLALQMFEKTAKEHQSLHYVSFEKYPLSKDQISVALSEWSAELDYNLKRLLLLYPLRVPAFHRVNIDKRVTLTLIFDDVNRSISELEVPQGVDAWFLDGFAPSKNPEMWTDTIFSSIRRLSKPGATFSTFTVAGTVKRGLQEAGFDVSKQKGFGRKREMLTGYAANSKPKDNVRQPVNKVSIIGGGLAGSACAHLLKQHSKTVEIIEQNNALASGASGNIRGLFNPRISSHRSPEQQYYAAAYSQLLRTLKELLPDQGSLDLNQCGSLHLVTDSTKNKRFLSALEQWGWASEHLQYVNAEEASDIAGLSLERQALYLGDSGNVSPLELTRSYSEGTECSYNTRVESLNLLDSDIIIVANGQNVAGFEQTNWLPVHSVRGQISEVNAIKLSEKIQTNICYGGYISPSHHGKHVIGATFQKWLDHTDIEQKDHEENLLKCNEAIGTSFSLDNVLAGRASLRCSSADHFPIVGQLPDYKSWIGGSDSFYSNIFISSAHGSHGIISSIASANIILDIALGRPYSLPKSVVELLNPSRFLKRLRKKGQLS